jgi:hypothetical protein
LSSWQTTGADVRLNCQGATRRFAAISCRARSNRLLLESHSDITKTRLGIDAFRNRASYMSTIAPNHCRNVPHTICASCIDIAKSIGTSNAKDVQVSTSCCEVQRKSRKTDATRVNARLMPLSSNAAAHHRIRYTCSTRVEATCVEQLLHPLDT